MGAVYGWVLTVVQVLAPTWLKSQQVNLAKGVNYRARRAGRLGSRREYSGALSSGHRAPPTGLSGLLRAEAGPTIGPIPRRFLCPRRSVAGFLRVTNVIC
jgi:hypothetical protein